MHEIGVKVVGVWGEFFQCPDGYDRNKAIDDAISFCNILADEGEKWGIQTALEPNANPDTLFPSYKEGLAFAKLTGRRSIRLMADLNYFLKLNEPLDDIRIDPSYCLHVQMAGEGNGFSQPNLVPRTAAYGELFTILKDIGYNGTVSVASPWYSTTGSDQIDWRYETAIALDYMRKLRDEYFA
jgi:sugar phosphate isomerase/epimerase